MWLTAVRHPLPAKILPLPLLYFLQNAALFPRAGEAVIDYRAAGFRCSDGTWEELDTRPYFPMHADDKENRFARAMHFYRQHRGGLQALEHFILAHENAARLPAAQLGGVRLSSLRLPVPPVGVPPPRARRAPMKSYAEARRHDWYWTPESRRREQCQGAGAS